MLSYGIRIISSGLVATSLMSQVLETTPTKVDIPEVLGSKLNEDLPPPDGSEQENFGTAVHYFLGGVVFPLAFETVFKKATFGPAVVKSAIWGVALWSFAETVVMPVIGKGRFFSRPNVALKYLCGHLVYGLAYGLMRPRMDSGDKKR